MKFACRIGYHEWGKWGDPYEQPMVTKYVDPITWERMPEFDTDHVEERQKRACVDCGRVQRRALRKVVGR